MGIPNVFQTGRTGMVAAKAAIATSGHNISNANTEGYSRQRVMTEAAVDSNSKGVGTKGIIGSGTAISRVERVNDEYVEKQLRNGNRDMAGLEEREAMLRQTEDIFNEMNGDGVNRLISRYFNEFRKLSNEPENEAIRHSVREASEAMVQDFHRLSKEVENVRHHIDTRLEGYTREANAAAEEVRDLNVRIKIAEVGGAPANDLQDKRDQALKRLASYLDVSSYKDNQGSYSIDIRGVGPLVTGPVAQRLTTDTSPADDQGKIEGALDLKTSGSSPGIITHVAKGGKMGALLEVRDGLLSTIQGRLDELAYNVGTAINEIHQQGFNRHGLQGVNFFAPLESRDRAAELLQVSDEIRANVNNIATAAQPDSPGDNRIAIAIAGLQNMAIMNEGRATADEWYNSIVSDIGVAGAKNRSTLHQQADIMTQLTKMRDQISGVSIDEETANLMQFQHAFDASAKIIQIADECLRTVLELRR